MRPFFEALANELPIWRDFWLVCLFTGARGGNVASMAWRELDLTQSLWFIPGEKMKNGKPQVVALVPPVLAILKSREVGRGSEYVFNRANAHIIDPRKSWARVVKRSGLENLRPHDLRRSLGSWQALAGASMAIIGASLGHRDLKSTQVYARLQTDPVRQSITGAVQAMEAAGNVIDVVAPKKPRKGKSSPAKET